MERKDNKYSYRISLATQIGTRTGSLLLSVIGNKIDGILDILGERQHCTGELEADGNCTFSGQLKTLRSVYDYTATGHFDENNILLNLKYKHGILHLVGQHIAKSEVL